MPGCFLCEHPGTLQRLPMACRADASACLPSTRCDLVAISNPLVGVKRKVGQKFWWPECAAGKYDGLSLNPLEQMFVKVKQMCIDQVLRQSGSPCPACNPVTTRTHLFPTSLHLVAASPA